MPHKGTFLKGKTKGNYYTEVPSVTEGQEMETRIFTSDGMTKNDSFLTTGDSDVKALKEAFLAEKSMSTTTLRYSLKETPPLPITIMSALQHILLSISGCLTTSSVVADVACVPYDHPIRSQLFCTTIFMVGLCTILQTAFGVRLPIFQGPSSSFLVPLLALQRDTKWKCVTPLDKSNNLMSNLTMTTMATNESVYETQEDMLSGMLWRLQEMSGALMLSSIFEILMGCSGLLNVLLRFIGPITVACTISLIGISLFRLPIIYGRPNFPIALGCAALSLLFILYLQQVSIPLPKCGKGKKKAPRSTLPIFELLPILLAVVILWVLTWILTLCNVFTDDKNDPVYMARADAKIKIIQDSGWFQWTYPGQFGAPKLSIALTLGFLVAILSSVVESVGDYYAAHQACELPAPPDHAISRGIFIEGIGSIISGAVGSGHATTSYSGNIALLTLSKTTSRCVMYYAGGILLIVSLFGKAGAALTTIPNPILGGVILIICGTLVSIGFSYLKNVDMSSARNLLVVGIPFMAGIIVPACLDKYPNIIDTGHEESNRVISIVLGTPMFLGGMIAMILDCTVPGTKESRGMAHLEKVHGGDGSDHSDFSELDDTYSWSVYPRMVRLCPVLNYIPFLPKVPKGAMGNMSPYDAESFTKM